MAKTFDRAVSGFNHNINHGGRVFHVQTEDSGLNNPNIVTHLFVGGNILASKKTSYADLVRAENLHELVRQLMEEQHKQMLRNVISGAYDSIDSAVQAYQPGQLGIPGGGKAVSGPTPGGEPLPAEVVEARGLTSPPALNESGAKTLFGEDLISEKSLDEVILSYLAGENEA